MRRIIGLTWTLTGMILPIVIWMIIRGMWMGLLALPAMCQGIPGHCERIADIWTQRAIAERNLPTNVERDVRALFGFIAWLTMAAGWIILAHITCWLWRIIT